MSWVKNNLYWADIALLWLLHTYSDSTGTVPSHRELQDLWNNTMINMGAFSEGFAQPITASQRLESAIKAFRRLNLIEATGKYHLTGEGRLFLLDLDPAWSKWPTSIPIKGNRLLMNEAHYMED